MRLIEIWNADLKKSYELYNSFLPDENGFENPVFGMDFEMYKQYVDLCLEHSKGNKLRAGYVPDTKYIIEENNNYVGIINFRHELNEFLENGPGHVGYGVLKEYRGKGYMNKALAMLIDKAKQKNIKELYLSCYKTNVASLKVMLKNGGYIHHDDDTFYYVRINLE